MSYEVYQNANNELPNESALESGQYQCVDPVKHLMGAKFLVRSTHLQAFYIKLDYRNIGLLLISSSYIVQDELVAR